jgi:lipoyl(octanoyl) transferase
VPDLICRRLGCVPYFDSWRAMRNFTDVRGPESTDECWLLEHPTVYTLGQAGRREHILSAAGIPIVQSDRGGQVTFHGPGQIVMYTLFDLRRLGIGVRELVLRLENVVVGLLQQYAIAATGRRDAPGVYVDGAKIAALGLRVRKGCTYHGLSLNVAMDMAPFAGIDPCGYPGLQVTQLSDHGVAKPLDEIGNQLIDSVAHEFGYNAVKPWKTTMPQSTTATYE